MFRCVTDGVTTIKPGHQKTGNACIIWSGESSVVIHTVPYIRKILLFENTQGTLQFRVSGSVPTVKHGRGPVMVWAAISWYNILLFPLLFFMNYCKEVRGQVG
jgi:hypothetical protein